MRNAGLEEAQAGIKIAGKNINNHTCADGIALLAEIEEVLKRLDESERGNEKVGLKLNIQKLRSRHPIPSLHGK